MRPLILRDASLRSAPQDEGGRGACGTATIGPAARIPHPEEARSAVSKDEAEEWPLLAIHNLGACGTHGAAHPWRRPLTRRPQNEARFLRSFMVRSGAKRRVSNHVRSQAS